ncbi:MAG TPA: preprotein translocase subunit SecE [Candidatus Saccharibacteria bacterium]|nr:preprotein translocase subunit SecE [Candidatus Saccharibacteria bacterium]
MAQKSKASGSKAKSSSTSTKVTRITAADSTPKEKTTKTKTASAKKEVTKKAETTPKKTVEKKQGFFKAIGEYFKGSWAELRQVRWPNRRTTWSLTFAVLVFTAFFVLLITVLDYVFQLVFEQILG